MCFLTARVLIITVLPIISESVVFCLFFVGHTLCSLLLSTFKNITLILFLRFMFWSKSINQFILVASIKFVALKRIKEEKSKSKNK